MLGVVRTISVTAGIIAAVAGLCVALSACETTPGQPSDPPAGAPPTPTPTPTQTQTPTRRQPDGAATGHDDARPRRSVTEYAGELRSSAELQAALFGFADTYIAVTSEAADKLIAAATTNERRVQAIRAKLDGAQDVIKIVTGPNPTVALMDIAVMVTVQHQVWDEYWAKEVFTGPEAESYSSAMRRVDREAWRIVGQSIPQDDVTALQELAANIHRWYRRQAYVTSIRASSVTKDITDEPGLKPKPSLLTLFGVDPLAGLSPAVAEATKMRLLGERVFYYTQKMPTLVQWRSQLTLAETIALPESQKALANMDSTVESVRRLSQTVEDLPGVIASNRERVVREIAETTAAQLDHVKEILATERTAILAGVAKEREAMLAAFDERHEEARAVLAELRTTVDAADRLTNSVKGVLVEVKALSGEKDPAAPAGRPFDIREYQQTIESATGSLKELNAAVQSAKELVDSPRWQEREQAIRAMTDDLRTTATRLIVYASIGLALALFFGMSGAFAVRRWLGRAGARSPA